MKYKLLEIKEPRTCNYFSCSCGFRKNRFDFYLLNSELLVQCVECNGYFKLETTKHLIKKKPLKITKSKLLDVKVKKVKKNR